jgi:hypothetical protein
MDTQRLAGASLLVFANKQDIQGSMPVSEIRDVSSCCSIMKPMIDWLRWLTKALDLRLIKSHHWKIWSCSAVTGDNLVEGLDWVVDDIAGRLYYSSTTTSLQPVPQAMVRFWSYILPFTVDIDWWLASSLNRDTTLPLGRVRLIRRWICIALR